MQKINISAQLSSVSDLDTDLIERLLGALGDVSSVAISKVSIKSTEGHTRSIWLHSSDDDTEPYTLVSGVDAYEGIQILDDDVLADLFAKGVCIRMKACYPNGAKYGIPDWAAVPAHAYGDQERKGPDQPSAMIPASEGFSVAERFEAQCVDTQDDSLQEFWYEISVPADSRVLELVDKGANPTDTHKADCRWQISVEWWNGYKSETPITAEQEEILQEEGFARAVSMMAEGFTCGELHSTITHEGSDGEELPFSGYWSISQAG